MEITSQKLRAASEASRTALKMHDLVSSPSLRKKLNKLIRPFGVFSLFNLERNSKRNSKLNGVAIAVIVKNEAPYIKEWVEYYKIIGITKIYLYDNDSQDDLKDRIKTDVESGYIDYHPIHGKVRQSDAYNKALWQARKDRLYLLVIDADEFLFMKNSTDRLFDIVKGKLNVNDGVGGLAINWLIFGSSHYEIKQPGLVTQTFVKRSPFGFKFNKHVKTLVNPDVVAGFLNPHFPVYIAGYHSVNLNGQTVEGPFNEPSADPEIRLNHYFTKSKEEFIKKRSRGMADNLNIRDMGKFEEHDQNDVFDDSMKRYQDELEKAVQNDGREDA
ncbi:glycosyltransferase family 2 protein [Limosilactobacillus fermentum]|uniref:glycosyltransferase family 2 protein n=1 Tax=Limosilactobacillus fermentum TaxID=1613 RepID=UPI0021A74BC6|nr:glycosyltransferase family 2 protein [Limosilactobacillus fermentum]MCT3449270.1 glycosyltransferase family 2 protein [Limosilactobacillus fermentum]MCT3454067.1 glycosyltransferase family 2 protein [Limosilactobacillus fermentum]